MGELAEFLRRMPALDTAELCLGEVEPAGDGLLSEYASMVRVAPVRGDQVAKVPAVESIAQMIM
jgi:hypothetical protein